MPPDPTAPPGDLDTSAKALYRKLRTYLRDQARTWEDTDKHVLGLACRAEQRARDARAGMVDEDGKPTLTSKGYKGQDVQHPNLKTAREAEHDFFEYLKELGITPKARAALGIEPPPDPDDPFAGTFG